MYNVYLPFSNCSPQERYGSKLKNKNINQIPCSPQEQNIRKSHVLVVRVQYFVIPYMLPPHLFMVYLKGGDQQKQTFCCSPNMNSKSID